MKRLSKDKAESIIYDELVVLHGKKITVRELARRINKLTAYTWVLSKVNELEKSGKINTEMSSMIGKNGNKVVCKLVWVGPK